MSKYKCVLCSRTKIVELGQFFGITDKKFICNDCMRSINYITNDKASTRDYFAASAMQGIISSCTYSDTDSAYRDMAAEAGKMADAMMKEREK